MSSMGKQSSSEMFEELKKRTVVCVNEANPEAIESLRQFVAKCDDHFINSLYQYSIFPLRLIIANVTKITDNCGKTLESSVECLSLILQKSRINRFDIFADVLANLLQLIDDNPNTINDEEIKFKASEDLILSVIKCSKTLIQNCDDSLLDQLISPQFSAQFGHSIHILLSVANKQKYSQIKAEAIETINCLISKCHQSLPKDDNSKAQDLIAYFLPGISTNCTKLITSDDKLNRRVITSLLTLLSNTIVLVFKSTPVSTDTNGVDDSKQLTNLSTGDPEECHRNGFIITRNRKWLESSCEKLNIVFDKIISCLISHQNWSIRLSLQQFVSQILTNCCSLFVNNCFASLIKVSLTYLSDDFEQIRHESDQFISKLSKTNVTSDSSKSYLDLIEDQIYTYITRLPRIVRTCSDREKITSIYLLFGYLKCLDTEGINYMLYSPQHKQRLFECLIDICHFDYHGIRLLELIAHNDNISHLAEEQVQQKWIRKEFSYLNDDKSVAAITNCCQLIGQRCDPEVLIDYLMDALRESKMNSSVIFVANQIMANVNCDFKEIEEMLDLYLAHIKTILEDQNVEDMNKDILRQCLLIEGLTVFLHLYDSKTSHNYLMKCLFPLIQSVGSLNLSIYQTSHRALTLVANYLSYNSISKLIDSNSDYLINFVCINLKHFVDNQRVPIVIKVMLKYSTQEMLPLFVDVIDEIIVVVDCYHKSQALPLMQVLQSFVMTLNHYFIENDKLVDNRVVIDRNQRCRTNYMIESFVNDFDEFMKNKLILEDFDKVDELIGDNEDNDECVVNKDVDDNETDDSKPKVPFYVPLINKICERCVHIISNTDPKVRIIVLEIINECLICLKPFEDHLLPMSHKLWAPLVQRFTEKDIIVVKRSFTCLQIMSQTCGDFIRVRTIKEVMPKILTFLRTQLPISFKKDKASAYRFTVAYSLQIDVLSGIASIAKNLDLRDKDLWPLIVEIIPYLNTYQPLPLQESAISALITIADLDIGSVYYYLKMIYSVDDVVKHENKFCAELRFTGNKPEFAKNQIICT
ncbi:TELO2-interacting protein 1 homolog [Oppia nitens]|uniref:TELO2-interacting protein 1 homolog n=1 Tax=Oppia nitens TaxID=1686743 RepID=UPI0023DC4B4A|nr:TELO2-interacting protein 1 homolog [Oppia nitens]